MSVAIRMLSGLTLALPVYASGGWNPKNAARMACAYVAGLNIADKAQSIVENKNMTDLKKTILISIYATSVLVASAWISVGIHSLCPEFSIGNTIALYSSGFCGLVVAEYLEENKYSFAANIVKCVGVGLNCTGSLMLLGASRKT